jgi:hypothetical protein
MQREATASPFPTTYCQRRRLPQGASCGAPLIREFRVRPTVLIKGGVMIPVGSTLLVPPVRPVRGNKRYE